jgi:cytochrome c nitrite reductase small subunit
MNQTAKPVPASTGPKQAKRRWLPVAVVALLGASLGVSGYTFHYAEGLSYLSNNPNACINCHIMQEHFDGWQHASHHAHAVCNDCHVPHDSVARKYFVKAEHGYRHSKGFTFNDFHEPIQITPGSRAVVVENCVRCHASIGGDLTAHGIDAATGGTPGPVVADCLHCHGRVGHGPSH